MSKNTLKEPIVFKYIKYIDTHTEHLIILLILLKIKFVVLYFIIIINNFYVNIIIQFKIII